MSKKKKDTLKGKTDDIAESGCKSCDDYDDVCKECRAKEEEEEDEENNGWGKKFIMSSVNDDEDFPLVLVTTPTKCFIGAFVPTEDEDEKGLFVCSPLMMLEVMDEREKKIGIMFRKLFHNLAVQEFIRVRYESFAFLKSASVSDRELAVRYGREVLSLRALESGVLVPTAQDVGLSNIGKN